MKKILIVSATMFMSFSVFADNHNSSAASEVKNATTAFNKAYETNDVEGYFNMYADDAMLYFTVTDGKYPLIMIIGRPQWSELVAVLKKIRCPMHK